MDLNKVDFTKDDAIKFAENRLWEPMTHRQRAEFQMRAKLLCMPFGVFHEALEKTLGRPVYTHEIGLDWDGLVDELFGNRKPPTLSEIISLVPKDKRLMVVAGNKKSQNIDESKK